MDFNDLYDAGGDIIDAVNDAVNRNDYSRLSENIKKTVKEVSDTIQRDVRQYNEKDRNQDVRRRVYRNAAGQGRTQYGSNPYRRYEYAAPGAQQRMRREQQPQPRYVTPKSAFIQQIVSKQKGIGKIIGGVAGLFVFGPFLLGDFFTILMGGISGGVLFGLLATALIIAGCIYCIMSGKKDQELVKRYYAYGKAIGDAEYIEIAKLARLTGRTKEEVLKDIKDLKDKNLLKQAWLDDQETTLILTEEVYNQYQQIRAESERMRQEAEQDNAADAELPENARAIIKEGREYIQAIHSLNDEIPGVEMSEKLYRLESTMDRIVEQVRQQPESASELRKLMSYYLPTTVKLLSAYKELDKQTVDGDNIRNTKKEIEDALDTINDAFEKLLDSMFQDMAWDVSSDISVMQTMLAQDGLTEKQMSAAEGQSVADLENQVYGTTLVWGDGDGAVQMQAQAQEEGK